MTFTSYYNRLSTLLDRRTPTADEARRDYQEMERRRSDAALFAR